MAHLVATTAVLAMQVSGVIISGEQSGQTKAKFEADMARLRYIGTVGRSSVVRVTIVGLWTVAAAGETRKSGAIVTATRVVGTTQRIAVREIILPISLTWVVRACCLTVRVAARTRTGLLNQAQTDTDSDCDRENQRGAHDGGW